MTGSFITGPNQSGVSRLADKSIIAQIPSVTAAFEEPKSPDLDADNCYFRFFWFLLRDRAACFRFSLPFALAL